MSGRVAVIGAGSSGMAAVKNLKDAGFTDIVCFERRDVMYGLWHYTEKAAKWEDESCVNKSTVINTSKEFMAFSDYPMPEHYPNFCHNRDVEEYFKDYTRNFGVEKHVRYNVEVMQLKKHSSYERTGKWEIRVKDHKTGQETQEVYDFVMVCNGHHGEPHRPQFPGQDKFKGKILHSKEYKDVMEFDDKRIVVVGIGNSGGDIASEASKFGQVFLATRRGAWVMKRLVEKGNPWDEAFHVRFNMYLNKILPLSVITNSLKKQLNTTFDHDKYCMTPAHLPGATHPTVNDELPNRIACGKVIVKPNIKNFTENGVAFEDGTYEEVDAVIMCTGYKIGYKFIDPSVIDVQNNLVSMYRNMFIPGLPKQTLAFLGVCQPLGSLFPIAEMQTRVAARVFKGEVTLPSEANMLRDIRAHQAATQARYVQSQRHTIQVDYLPYMDELATMVGCRPNLFKLFFTDFTLFKALMFGPGVAYQYRLQGPNQWPGARNAILTTSDRINKPLATRQIPVKQGFDTCTQSTGFWIKVVLFAALVALGSYYFKLNGANFRFLLDKLPFN